MRKTIWTCWFQGLEAAPPLVAACVGSWREKNPDWEVRCLDASTVQDYARIRDHINLNAQRLTAASLADVLRIMLLRDFGGVWVDATTYCNRPLTGWLGRLMDEGFFAFDKPGGDRALASWFLAASPENQLVRKWHRATLDYWAHRQRTDDYFWFHHRFSEVCENDVDAADSWARVPKISADGPHSLQGWDRLYRPADDVELEVDWEIPIFKLTYRIDNARVPPDGGILRRLFGPSGQKVDKLPSRSGLDVVALLGPVAPSSELPPPA